VYTENAILIHARAETIYALAAAVERWPERLPHYRWVHVLEDHGSRRVVEMAARRDWIPVRWWAEQELFPEEPRIVFRHVGGVTRGMWVEWTFTPQTDGVLVRIEHELRLGWPLIGGIVADHVIGPRFVGNIAGKTLRRIKQLAEAAEKASPPAAPTPSQQDVR
jgi:ribosome-associated toxin RatA of RatAB toxin-antitoxin module